MTTLTASDFCQGHGAECTDYYDDCGSDHGVRSYCDGTCQEARELHEDYLDSQALYLPQAFRDDAIVLDVRGHGRAPESYRVTFEGRDVEARALAYKAARPDFYFDEVRVAPISRTFRTLLAALYPVCEHGLSLDLCEGPDHYMTRDQEMAHGW